MAGSPEFKVYSAEGEYIAACKHAEDAAALVAFRGDGTQIRIGHKASRTVWIEGSEEQPADESFDYVAQVIEERRAGRLRWSS